MPTDFTFRLVTYVSLGLAALCLGYSEWDLLPEVTAFTAGVIALLFVSFRVDGRYQMSLATANRMGAVIFVVAAAWIGWRRYLHPPESLRALAGPTGLLPYLGPLLMVLIPAKLFRPKHAGDWWGLQGVGAAAVGLACAISDDAIFAGLLAAYAVAAVWSASLFFHRRWAGAVPPVPGFPARPGPLVVPAAGARSARSVAGWAAGALAVALPLFFLTPRSPAAKWQVRARAETGYSGEQVVDLTTTGTLQVNRSVAFEVLAEHPDGTPKTDLSSETRWRGDAFSVYEKGKWTRPTHDLDLFAPAGLTRGGRLAHLGPDEFFLSYQPDPSQKAPVVADPVAWVPGQPAPVASLLTGGRVRSWDLAGDGSFVLPLDRSTDPRVAGVRRLDPYYQVARVGPEPDLGPGFKPNTGPGPSDAVARLQALPAEGGRGVREWAEGFLDELIRRGKLPADATEPAPAPRTGRWVKPEAVEAAALLFRDHFAKSGEYRYGLDLRRGDPALDPVEDFLKNVKAGHCQRFASALALSLRAVGVPCALVVGFKGCEHEGGGKYVVRQEHAHAWVSVLVPRPTGLWHWRSVDPTPGLDGTADTGPAAETWLGTARTAGQAFYTDYIVGYDPDRRKQVLQAGRQHLSDHGRDYAGGAIALAGLALGVLVLRWVVRRRPGDGATPNATGVEWYDSVVIVLTEAGHPIRPGQTPGEYAAETSAALRDDPRTADVADVPTEAAAALYELRYAGRPLTIDRQSALHAAADRLAAALRSLPAPEAPRA